MPLVLLAALFGASVSCSCCGDDVVGDGGASDASDTAMDTADDGHGLEDAPEDSVDAVTDVVAPPDAGFEVPVGVPADCQVRVASNSTALGTLGFQPCVGGPEDCRQLEVDWGDVGVRGTLRILYFLDSSWGERRVVGFNRTTTDGFELVTFHLDGAIQTIVRHETGGDACVVGTPSGSGERLAIPILLRDRHLPASAMVLRTSAGTSDAVVLDASVVGASRIQRLSLGRTGTIGIELIPTLRPAVLTDSTVALVSAEYSINVPRILGDRFLFRENSPRLRFSAASDELIALPFIERDDTDVLRLVVSGESFAWMEGGERAGSSTRWNDRRVFVARMPAGDAELDPRLVAELGPGLAVDMALGPDWVVYDHPTRAPDAVVAVEIASGRQIEIDAPRGKALFPLQVMNDVAVLAVRDAVSGLDETFWFVGLD